MRRVRTSHFLEWEDGPPLYKDTKSEICLVPHFSDQSYATDSTQPDILTIALLAAYYFHYTL